MTPSVELPKRRALGKGLESLLPGRSGFTPPPTPSAAPVPDEGKPREIPVDQIERNPFQTRAAVERLLNLLDRLKRAGGGLISPLVQGVRYRGSLTEEAVWLRDSLQSVHWL